MKFGTCQIFQYEEFYQDVLNILISIWKSVKAKSKKNYTKIDFEQNLPPVEPCTLQMRSHFYIEQGRHDRFLAGKDAILLVVATSPACNRWRHHFLFLKIQPRTKPWLPCFLWWPCRVLLHVGCFDHQLSMVVAEERFVTCLYKIQKFSFQTKLFFL
jgi:hypothetical protein